MNTTVGKSRFIRPVGPRAPWAMLVLMLGLCPALALGDAAAPAATLATTATTVVAPAAQPPVATPQPKRPERRKEPRDTDEENDNPQIILHGFTAQVTRSGEVRQVIRGNWARMDEKENIMDVRQVEARMFDGGKLTGLAQAGLGRVWMKARPKEQVGAQDVLFSEGALYRMNKGWVLSTPAMRFLNKQRMVLSNQGYVKQLPVKDGYLIGRGQKFEIGVNPATNSFESWREYGNPAVLEKSKKPEILP